MLAIITGTVTFIGGLCLAGMILATLIMGVRLLCQALNAIFFFFAKPLFWVAGFFLFWAWKIIRDPREIWPFIKLMLGLPFAVIFGLILGIIDPIRSLFSNPDQSPKRHPATLPLHQPRTR